MDYLCLRVHEERREAVFMNIQEFDILGTLGSEPFINQRILAESSGYSLGVVNRALRALISQEYLTDGMQLTEKARKLYREARPRSAIILAAGSGMRMVPINAAVPKALLEVRGEPLIERVIRQLHEVGVERITVVVGFMKERFDYLIDQYGVRLEVNTDYAYRNSLSSLALVSDDIADTYIVPGDVWCERNPFRDHEFYSWYMVSGAADPESEVRVNRKKELVQAVGRAGGNAMIGISYLSGRDAAAIRERIRELNDSGEHDEDFWEAALYQQGKMIVPARIVSGAEAVAIKTYEQLRDLDSDSSNLRSDALNVIADVFQTTIDRIVDISVLKKGMTNRSFRFSVNGEKYVMRIPGEGTDQLINRREEAQVFQTIRGLGFCDDPVYINPENGYKITKLLEGIRVADSDDVGDLRKCMAMLRSFHEMRLKVEHHFDIFGQIEFYEGLWKGQASAYRDYQETKRNVLSLRAYIDSQEKPWCLTHIDAVPDNFLFFTGPDGTERLQLTDWEYASMQDPHVDIAMFCIYSLYDKAQVDRLIDIYFEGKCDHAVRTKIYCYIAACGLLWSNWCEFKRQLGVEFGEYSLRQYRFAKDYYRHAMKSISAEGME